MRITLSSFLTLSSFTISIIASPSVEYQHHCHHHHHYHHYHHHQRVKGKVFDHFLQVWFENQDFELVSELPAWKTLAKEGILLDSYSALTHPSEPNYVAAAGGSTFGITNDDYYNIPKNISTIYDLLEKKGLTWKVYQEDIPSVGYPGYKIGQYVRKHNPAIIFDSIAQDPARAKFVVPGIELDIDIAANTLPNWMFYTPNMLNDGHDTNTTYAGDWLTGFYQSTLSKPNLSNKTLILITFDENHTKPIRNRVWSLLLGAIPDHLKGTNDSTYYTHYSTLHTVEQNWDLGSLGRGDANKTDNNVFDFVAKKIGYKNTVVPVDQIPLYNSSIPGLLTGKSFNQTHPKGGIPPP
ncbi:phosphoesterase family-domain-containing protein [Halteromyces radiatus]|uniref:phosphoesterase family-domain-containing protein n=1 Tax=Halteromyces radiatus TaxID=101107 RepID=UPI00221F8E3C|nr:phosphoesterase family-domain-containing protein [Halteromyces radiatus]KAI8083057.1 phosphoesterase family-domain-containing protein [Halteromyces radiatus]